jgi:acyl transferase domain-containing protein/SAM-dependent methyltransferase
VTLLCQDLSDNGVSVLDTGFFGRYHSSSHKDVPDKILAACHELFSPRFANQNLVRSNTDGKIIPSENAAGVILQCILVDHANWFSTISSAVSALPQSLGSSFILSIGTDAVPQSISKRFPVAKIATIVPKDTDVSKLVPSDIKPDPKKPFYPDHAIAVIGMACKFPGADSIDEFWRILTEGKSMLEQMPKERFTIDDLPRANGNLHFWGNFVRDVDAFDHKFFKKSAREAASMDPQQRILLQTAYVALESSGYFSDPSRPRDIGCYLGSCSTDYDSNVASHPPTAYSTTGTLRAFLSGKISHYFGWSGPSLVFDTACSSSAVAIHTACKALQMGECSQAMAGGVTLLSAPYLYENLSAAHFLSPSGATKPFDASADGYCRGEGAGLVVLKKLSDARADNDNILGVIAGSAINQNSNCVSITVPHSPSQGNLYQRVAIQAGITPHELTFVEAHGTGTPVGDPIEMESIREVFGGPRRDAPLFVSSVKGNIGHLEGASGVAALIKALLQMEYRTACTQASFKRLNPKIPALEPDGLSIPTSNHPLSGDVLTSCVNNYGAAGSNAAMILVEAPRKQKSSPQDFALDLSSRPSKYPIQLAAASTASLLAYCASLDEFCRRSLSSHDSGRQEQLLPNLAFSLARRQNQELAHVLTLTATNAIDLQIQLRQQTSSINTIKQRPKELPVVLCFGGQISECVDLSKRLWLQSSLLRFHLDRCDENLRSMGYPGLYPGIFQPEPVTDVVALQSMVFALQYASAQSWLDSGLKVDALVGHSLGQITAMCVSGMLSLRDGLKLIAGRASLMREHWGSEPGTMIAVEADQQTVDDLIQTATATNTRYRYEIACYNGPTSHVVVSDKASADELEAKIVKRVMRYKRLNVTYGFHSRFTQAFLPHLEKLASSLVFRDAQIPLETCTDEISWSKPTAKLIAAHTRDPVFFGQAVERLQSRLGACTWVEAGSDSSIIGMVRRALGNSHKESNNFLPAQLNKQGSLELLVDNTLNLWNCGHRVQFWNFHRLQTLEYDVLRVPSYNFEKPKHWLELNTAPPADQNTTAFISHSDGAASMPLPTVFIRFLGADSQGHHFEIDSRSEEYQTLVTGHVMLGSAQSPMTLYVELASRAARLVGEVEANCLLSVQNLEIHSPLGLAADRNINIHLQRLPDSWTFIVTSKARSSTEPKHATAVDHATGVVCLQPVDRNLQAEFARYERLASHDKIAAVLNDTQSECIQGAMVYKVFSQVMDYSECYQGLRSIASRTGQIVGKVLPPKHIPNSIRDSTDHPHLLDNFTQVACLHANCVYEHADDEVFWLTRVDRIQLGPDFKPHSQASWDVLAFTSTDGGEVTNDIFVYDSVTERLALHILGARLIKFSRTSLIDLFSNGNGASAAIITSAKKTHGTEIAPPITNKRQNPISPVASQPHAKPSQPAKNPKAAIHEDIALLLERIADVPRDQVEGKASFDDLGVDSLMMIEVINEISTLYHVDLPIEDLEELTDFNSLVEYLHRRGCTGISQSDRNGSSYALSSDGALSGSTPTSSASSAITTPSPTPSGSGVSQKLAKLVVEHLEMETELTLTTNLADHGLDSLLCIELASDIKKIFSVEIDMENLDHESTFGDLLNMVLEDGSTDAAVFAAPVTTPATKLQSNSTSTAALTRDLALNVQADNRGLSDATKVFENIRFDFDKHSDQVHFKDFWTKVYPQQADLVVGYIVEAFQNLGCNLAGLVNGEQVPPIDVLTKHRHLLNRLHKILEDGGLIESRSDHTYVRTTKPVDPTPSATLFKQMLERYPWHASETKLLNVTASRLSECLTGQKDPLQLLFANKANREILAAVYDIAPMCQATTRLLADFLVQKFLVSQSDSPFHILEIGAGTGGTARYLVDYLTLRGIKFEYTFTDISPALVTAAKKKFAGKDSMKFMTLDCDRAAAPELLNKFHIVIATNCIHATGNATTSAANVAPMLRDDGVFCLVEFTRGLYWFDLVYGLLEGWWLFSDGRQHALADEWFWDKSLRAAGYKHVSWTDGDTVEAQTLRLICAFKCEAGKVSYTPMPRTLPRVLQKRAGILTETFVFKRHGNLDLQADVYYPKHDDKAGMKRPIGAVDSKT